MKLLSNLDASNNQLLNAKLQQLASDLTPAAANTGNIFYNTASGLAKISNGTSLDTLTNILESITGSGAISVSGISGKSQTISVTAASAGAAGTMSASDFTKLAASTNANNASAIVQRDGSGNFTAGTITASLTGTASNASALNGQAASYYLSRTNQTGTQLAATISDLATTVQAYRQDQFAPPTANVAWNSQRITGLADPINPQDAATKNYVDGIATGLDVKASVRVASTANITLTYNATGGTAGRGQITAAPASVDGTSLVAGNRILLKDQTAGAQNGIWVVTTVGTGSNGVWDRATDFDNDAEVTAGAFTFVEEGTVNDNSGFTLATNNPITIGGSSGTSLQFVQFSGAGTITTGNGLQRSGSVISAVGTSGRISVGASIDIDAAYVGQASITTLGTITSGVWNGTTIAVANGGTGATTAAGAKTNLGFVTKFSQTLSTSATTYSITHNLNSTDIDVSLMEVSTGAIVLADFVATNANTISITFGSAPAANAYRVSVFA